MPPLSKQILEKRKLYQPTTPIQQGYFTLKMCMSVQQALMFNNCTTLGQHDTLKTRLRHQVNTYIQVWHSNCYQNIQFCFNNNDQLRSERAQKKSIFYFSFMLIFAIAAVLPFLSLIPDSIILTKI